MTVRGGGVPEIPTALMPVVRMGPPPRSFAADAHHCIMVRVSAPTAYKDVHECSCTNPRAPLDVVIPTTPSVPSRSEPSRTKPCGGANAPSLTAPARAGSLNVWVGAKKRAARIAVGTVIAHRPPHRPGRAQLRHPVLTSSV